MSDAERTADLANAPSAPGSGEIVEIAGVSVAIDPLCMSDRMQRLIRRGRLSQPEASLLPGCIEAGERFVELGGGIGYTSTLVAKTRRAAAIATFEANPGLISSIHTTHRLNGVEAVVRNAIVMARKTSTSVPFHVHRDFEISSLIEPPTGVRQVVQVPVISLDQLIAEFSPTMMMIDIEGAEVPLLSDVPLRGVKKVLLEFHINSTGHSGVRQVFDYFTSQSFYYDPAHSQGPVVLFRRLETGLLQRHGLLRYRHGRLRRVMRRLAGFAR